MTKENLTQIISEMQRVRQASLGEVILFNKQWHNGLSNLMPDFGYAQPPVKGVLFHGVLGIYDGVADMGSLIVVKGKDITLELTRKHNYELALIDQDGVIAPFIRIPLERNCIVLEDRAYIGPEEISAVLKEKCDGHYDRFFADYVKAHRRV